LKKKTFRTRIATEAETKDVKQ